MTRGVNHSHTRGGRPAIRMFSSEGSRFETAGGHLIKVEYDNQWEAMTRDVGMVITGSHKFRGHVSET